MKTFTVKFSYPSGVINIIIIHGLIRIYISFGGRLCGDFHAYELQRDGKFHEKGPRYYDISFRTLGIRCPYIKLSNQDTSKLSKENEKHAAT